MSINSHLVGPQASCIQYFKFLASQKVLYLLTVFDASLKEAKTTFLIPTRMTLINLSSLIIQLDLKQALYENLISQLAMNYSSSYVYSNLHGTPDTVPPLALLAKQNQSLSPRLRQSVKPKIKLNTLAHRLVQANVNNEYNPLNMKGGN